jgi:hypothetical protein
MVKKVNFLRTDFGPHNPLNLFNLIEIDLIDMINMTEFSLDPIPL